MIPLEELIQKWRKRGKRHGDMVRIRKSVLKNLNLPEESKQFLNKGGLIDIQYGGTMTPSLPRLTELISDIKAKPVIKPLPASFARYRSIGEIGHRMFQCLDEEADGRVVIVKVNPARVIFVNSSIQQYAACTIARGEGWDIVKSRGIDLTAQEWDEFVSDYEQAIREIDPAALAEEQNWLAREVARLKEGDIF